MTRQEIAKEPRIRRDVALAGIGRALFRKITIMLKVADPKVERIPLAQLSGWVLLVGAAMFTYAGCLASLAGRWWSDPDYLHGFLVPIFAGFLLWYRREMLRDVQAHGSRWGLVLLGVCAVMRWMSAYYYYELLDPASLSFPAWRG